MTTERGIYYLLICKLYEVIIMQHERPIFIKQETNLNSQERIAQQLKALQNIYDKNMREKAYPYLYKGKK